MPRSFSERLLKNIAPAYAASLAICAGAAVLLLRADPLMLLLALLLSPLLLELALRALLFLSYGRAYLFRIRPYLLKDHPIYGYSLRANVDMKKTSLRLYEKYAFRSAAGVIWNDEENLRARIALRTNSLGFRGPEFSPSKAAGVVRIFCSGGSTTAGQGVDDQETWPAQLQKNLASHGVKAEAINAGVYGWDSYQELLRFKHEIVRYQPDVLLLHEGWNEEFTYSSLDLGRDYRPRTARGFYEKYFFFCNPSVILPKRLLSLVLLYKNFRRERLLKEKMAFTVPERWQTLKKREYLQDWFDNIVEILEICSKRNIQVYLLNYPCLVDMGDEATERREYIRGSRLTALHAHYQAFSKARIDEFFRVLDDYAHVLDCAADFKSARSERRLELFTDELHLSAKGEALLGAAVCDKLLAHDNFTEFLKTGRAPSNALKPAKDLRGLRQCREHVGLNPKPLSMEIDRIRNALLKDRTEPSLDELPSDRYTTY